MVEQSSLFGDDEPKARPVPKEPTSLPYARGHETSRATAIKMLMAAKSQRAKVFQNFAEKDDFGVTDDEGMEALGLQGHSYHPRRGELLKMGLIYKSDEVRKTKAGNAAAVWKVVKE